MGHIKGTHDHLTMYHHVDIALDTFPYHGTTTTCEALWMGVPVISLIGNRHAPRVGASLLKQVGLEQCIAKNKAEYIKIAQTLSANLPALNDLRQNLRQKFQHSPLMDQQNFCKNFFQLLQSVTK